MAPEANQPTEAEWKILKIVFAHRSCAARDVIADASARHGWSDSTIKTLLRRLVDKGLLKTRAVGNSLLYRPNRSIHKALRESADQLMDRAVEGTVGPLLQYMVKRSKLSPQDLDALRDLIDQRRSSEDES